uniref:Cathepsin propeptide inhibitor domain-containing protein n=1 Tax=Panagrolaimus sp. PS1159 TaxID=55785 RepID=A0AC35GJV2_9BILA
MQRCGHYFVLFAIAWILLIVFIDNDEAYTINQYDRQWINALRSTSLAYANRAWEKRKWNEYLRAFAEDQAQGRKQTESIFGSNYTVNQNASFISKSKIYHFDHDIQK